MLICAIDAARRCGWAMGRAGTIPASGSWQLRRPGEDIHLEPAALVQRLMALFEEHGKPDIIAIERYMPPVASKAQDATITQIMAHGAVHAFAGISRINVHHWPVQTIRKQVCGRARAPDGKNKEMVLRTVHLLGLMPKDCKDDNRADALAVWRYAEDMVANVRGPMALVS